MYVANYRYLSMPMFSSIHSLPKKVLQCLKASRAGTFCREVFVRIDKKLFADPYSDKPSRPSSPINALVRLLILTADVGQNVGSFSRAASEL